MLTRPCANIPAISGVELGPGTSEPFVVSGSMIIVGPLTHAVLEYSECIESHLTAGQSDHPDFPRAITGVAHTLLDISSVSPNPRVPSFLDGRVLRKGYRLYQVFWVHTLLSARIPQLKQDIVGVPLESYVFHSSYTSAIGLLQ